MHNRNWDNLRFVLCVATHGTISAAARVLGVNHATVLRRVAAFERDHGGPVFQKTATGYRVLPDRANVIEAAREVENAVVSVERLMQGRRAAMRGLVRLSSTDSLCQSILPGLVRRLHDALPELQIEVMSTNSHLDFTRMQADISVRPARSLPEEMIGDSRVGLCFRAYAAPGAPALWLSPTGALARSVAAAWITAHIEPDHVGAGADSFMVLRELARLRAGIAVLPAFLGDPVPELEHRAELMPDLSVPIWVASHAELREVPRIRMVRERILDYLDGCRDLLDPPAAPVHR